MWFPPFVFSPVPHIVSDFQPNPSTAESSISKGGDLALCLLFDLSPNHYFNIERQFLHEVSLPNQCSVGKQGRNLNELFNKVDML